MLQGGNELIQICKQDIVQTLFNINLSAVQEGIQAFSHSIIEALYMFD